MLDYGTTDGHTNALDFGDLAALEGNVLYAVGLWVKQRTAAASARFVFADGRLTVGSDAGYGLERVNGTPGAFRVRHGDGAAMAAIDGTADMSDGETHSVYYSWHAGATNFVRFYFDGVFVTQQNLGTQRATNALAWILGNNSDKNDGYACQIGHFMYWHDFSQSPADADESAAVFHAGQLIPRADRLTLWHKGLASPGIDEISQIVPTASGTVGTISDAVDSYYQGEVLVPQHREVASRRLRRDRYSAPVYSPIANAIAAEWELGEAVNLAIHGGPRAASLIAAREIEQMVRSGQPVFCFLGGQSFNPATKVFRPELEDAEHFICGLWSTFKLTGAIDAERQFLAETNDSVKAFQRANAAYLQQADGFIADIGAGLEKMNAYGFWSEPERSNLLKNSNWALTSITTNWTDNSGDGSGAAETSDVLFKNTAKFPRALRIVKGTGNTLWTADAVAVLTAAGNHRLQFWYKCLAAAIGAWRLQRSSDSWYWNDGTEAWQAGSVFNALPAKASYGVHYSKPILVPGNTNWTLDIGIVSGSTNDVVLFGEVDIQNTRFACSPIPTLGAAVLQLEDVLQYATVDVLPYRKRHTIRLTYRAQQNAADLEDGDILPIAEGLFDSSDLIKCYYEKPAGANARFVMEADRSGSDGTAYKEVNIVMDQSYELMFRKTDASGYELGLPARTLSVLVDGVKGVDDQMTGDFADSLHLNDFFIGTDASASGAKTCAVISDFEVIPRAVPDEEALALR